MQRNSTSNMQWPKQYHEIYVFPLGFHVNVAVCFLNVVYISRWWSNESKYILPVCPLFSSFRVQALVRCRGRGQAISTAWCPPRNSRSLLRTSGYDVLAFPLGRHHFLGGLLPCLPGACFGPPRSLFLPSVAAFLATLRSASSSVASTMITALRKRAWSSVPGCGAKRVTIRSPRGIEFDGGRHVLWMCAKACSRRPAAPTSLAPFASWHRAAMTGPPPFPVRPFDPRGPPLQPVGGSSTSRTRSTFRSFNRVPPSTPQRPSRHPPGGPQASSSWRPPRFRGGGTSPSDDMDASASSSMAISLLGLSVSCPCMPCLSSLPGAAYRNFAASPRATLSRHRCSFAPLISPNSPSFLRTSQWSVDLLVSVFKRLGLV